VEGFVWAEVVEEEKQRPRWADGFVFGCDRTIEKRKKAYEQTNERTHGRLWYTLFSPYTLSPQRMRPPTHRDAALRGELRAVNARCCEGERRRRRGQHLGHHRVPAPLAARQSHVGPGHRVGPGVVQYGGALCVCV